MEVIGTCIGTELKKLMPTRREIRISSTVFSCPLDEALVECTIGTSPPSETASVFDYDLAPYGSFPKSTGRKLIGEMETQPLEYFWKAMFLSMGLSKFKLQKLRGHNGHHIVESSFKAFCRAFRCCLDDNLVMWNTLSDSFAQGISLQREASISRCTKETSINVHLKMDGAQNISIKTGIPFLDDFFTTLARECPSMSLAVECTGDLWVDDHHTTEDVAIAVGQAIHSALGSKAGLNRMWTSEAQQGGACHMQTSFRSFFESVF
jgi:imidazoleglycerol phosphate dehydratase HisB